MYPTARDPTTPLQAIDTPWFAESVELARKGDKSAFDSLYQHFYTQIRLYLAHMVGDDEEGQDLAQETFLKVWRGLPDMHNQYRFDTWLYRIATNTAFDHLRRRKFRWPRGKGSRDEDISEYMYISGPEDQVAEVEHIQQALAQVSLKYRSCLLLQFVANLPQREIATSLHISPKSVSIYVSRGCEQFRQAYQRLLQTSSMSLKKEEAQTNDRHDTYTLYRLGTETSG